MNDGRETLSPKSGRQCRVLLLRSCGRAPFAAAVAGGLLRVPGVEVWQYPEWPPEARAGLEKLPNADAAWESLQAGLIRDRADLLEKLGAGFFDLALVSDENGVLFRYRTMDAAEKVCAWTRWLYRSLVGGGRYQDGARHSRSLRMTPRAIAAILPVAAVDFADAPFLTPMGQVLLDGCSVYFKRELPFDRLFLYYKQTPDRWASRRAELLAQTDKVQGIPLGIEDDKYFALKNRRVTRQDVDVLFVGTMTSSMRRKGLERIESWARESSRRVEIAPALPFDAYCEKIARSKVTVSIAGGGWDCFRHYEAIALGSIPFMNKPTVDAVCWHGMPDAIFFENTFCDFDRKLEALLAGDAARSECLASLERMVERHALHSRIMEHVVRTTLERNKVADTSGELQR